MLKFALFCVLSYYFPSKTTIRFIVFFVSLPRTTEKTDNMDATPTPSPHEAQRGRILDTALALFRQHGVKAVTMDDVAHALTMSKRTLYQTFRDKEDLLLEAVKKSRRTELEEMESIAQEKDNVLEILLTAMDRRMKELETIAPAFFADIVKYGRVIDYLDACERDDTEKVVGFLRRGVAQGYFRNDVDLYLFYDMLGTLSKRVVGWHIDGGRDLRHLFLNTIPVSLRGLSTPKGQELVDAFVAKYGTPGETPATPQAR